MLSGHHLLFVAQFFLGPAANAAAESDGVTEEPTFAESFAQNVTFRPPQWNDFLIEIALLCVLGVYYLNYVRGKAANEKIAKAWMRTQKNVIEENFALVGDKGNLMIRDGAANYLLYASGRRYCEHMFVKVKLRARHDLIGRLYELVFPDSDKITVEVTLNKGDVEDFVFAIVPKKRALAMKKARWDIGNFTKQIQTDRIPSTHVCLGEGSELADSRTILNDRVCEALQAAGRHFEELIITDQPMEKPETKGTTFKTLTLTYTLSNDDSAIDLLSTAIDLIDVLAEDVTLRQETRTRAKKSRDEIQKELEKEVTKDRQETLQQQKSEQRRKELEKVSRMTPEQQRKWEEKERKKTLKKQMKQRTKVAK